MWADQDLGRALASIYLLEASHVLANTYLDQEVNLLFSTESTASVSSPKSAPSSTTGEEVRDVTTSSSISTSGNVKKEESLLHPSGPISSQVTVRVVDPHQNSKTMTFLSNQLLAEVLPAIAERFGIPMELITLRQGRSEILDLKKFVGDFTFDQNRPLHADFHARLIGGGKVKDTTTTVHPEVKVVVVPTLPLPNPSVSSTPKKEPTPRQFVSPRTGVEKFVCLYQAIVFENTDTDVEHAEKVRKFMNFALWLTKRIGDPGLLKACLEISRGNAVEMTGLYVAAAYLELQRTPLVVKFLNDKEWVFYRVPAPSYGNHQAVPLDKAPVVIEFIEPSKSCITFFANLFRPRRPMWHAHRQFEDGHVDIKTLPLFSTHPNYDVLITSLTGAPKYKKLRSQINLGQVVDENVMNAGIDDNDEEVVDENVMNAGIDDNVEEEEEQEEDGDNSTSSKDANNKRARESNQSSSPPLAVQSSSSSSSSSSPPLAVQSSSSVSNKKDEEAMEFALGQESSDETTTQLPVVGSPPRQISGSPIASNSLNGLSLNDASAFVKKRTHAMHHVLTQVSSVAVVTILDGSGLVVYESPLFTPSFDPVTRQLLAFSENKALKSISPTIPGIVRIVPPNGTVVITSSSVVWKAIIKKTIKPLATELAQDGKKLINLFARESDSEQVTEKAVKEYLAGSTNVSFIRVWPTNEGSIVSCYAYDNGESYFHTISQNCNPDTFGNATSEKIANAEREHSLPSGDLEFVKKRAEDGTGSNILGVTLEMTARMLSKLYQVNLDLKSKLRSEWTAELIKNIKANAKSRMDVRSSEVTKCQNYALFGIPKDVTVEAVDKEISKSKYDNVHILGLGAARKHLKDLISANYGKIQFGYVNSGYTYAGTDRFDKHFDGSGNSLPVFFAMIANTIKGDSVTSLNSTYIMYEGDNSEEGFTCEALLSIIFDSQQEPVNERLITGSDIFLFGANFISCGAGNNDPLTRASALASSELKEEKLGELEKRPFSRPGAAFIIDRILLHYPMEYPTRNAVLLLSARKGYSLYTRFVGKIGGKIIRDLVEHAYSLDPDLLIAARDAFRENMASRAAGVLSNNRGHKAAIEGAKAFLRSKGQGATPTFEKDAQAAAMAAATTGGGDIVADLRRIGATLPVQHRNEVLQVGKERMKFEREVRYVFKHCLVRARQIYPTETKNANALAQWAAFIAANEKGRETTLAIRQVRWWEKNIEKSNEPGQQPGAKCPGGELDDDLAASLPGWYRFNTTETAQCNPLRAQRALPL